MKIRSFVRKTVRVLLVLGLAGCLVMFLVNLYMIRKEEKYILTADQAGELEDVDCIMVLGCGVRPDGTPSGMLSDRLDQGIRLYDEHVSDKLLMSGDHGKVNYDEVNLMKQFAIDRAVPSENIFMDHAGFSTYESMYRALYVAQSMGMEAYGVASDPRTYGGQRMRDVRELLARPKDLIYTIVMPKPTYLGDSIPVSGDGNVTNDKDENRKRAVSATAVPQENE